MKELQDRLVAEANLTPEQALQSIEVVKEFVKAKFPMLSAAVDQIFGNKE